MTASPAQPFARKGPLPGPLGRLAAGLYGAAMRRRNRAFDAGRGVETLAVPVISVGNLSVGGTGKTPMVAHLCRVLLERGLRPCIAMRGYARGGGGGESDEADAYRREFGESVDVVARPDRAAGVAALLAGGGASRPRVVILDDGFQHRRIARQCDIVLVDASRDPFGDELLPAGWLRELPESLRRATAVVVTHAELATAEQLAELADKIARVHGRAPVAIARHLWTAVRMAGEGATTPRPLESLLGKRALGVCAIGNPRGFTDALRATVGPARAPEFVVLPDHDPYAARTVSRIMEAARRTSPEVIVVTDKDWSKLRRVPRGSWPCPVVLPVLSMAFLSGREALERMVIEAATRVAAR